MVQNGSSFTILFFIDLLRCFLRVPAPIKANASCKTFRAVVVQLASSELFSTTTLFFSMDKRRDFVDPKLRKERCARGQEVDNKEKMSECGCSQAKVSKRRWRRSHWLDTSGGHDLFFLHDIVTLVVKYLIHSIEIWGHHLSSVFREREHSLCIMMLCCLHSQLVQLTLTFPSLPCFFSFLESLKKNRILEKAFSFSLMKIN